jgi:hypothetical protein
VFTNRGALVVERPRTPMSFPRHGRAPVLPVVVVALRDATSGLHLPLDPGESRFQNGSASKPRQFARYALRCHRLRAPPQPPRPGPGGPRRRMPRSHCALAHDAGGRARLLSRVDRAVGLPPDEDPVVGLDRVERGILRCTEVGIDAFGSRNKCLSVLTVLLVFAALASRRAFARCAFLGGWGRGDIGGI